MVVNMRSLREAFIFYTTRRESSVPGVGDFVSISSPRGAIRFRPALKTFSFVVESWRIVNSLLAVFVARPIYEGWSTSVPRLLSYV